MRANKKSVEIMYLGSDLVAALSGLHVHDLPHVGGVGVVAGEEEEVVVVVEEATDVVLGGGEAESEGEPFLVGKVPPLALGAGKRIPFSPSSLSFPFSLAAAAEFSPAHSAFSAACPGREKKAVGDRWR